MQKGDIQYVLVWVVEAALPSATITAKFPSWEFIKHLIGAKLAKPTNQSTSRHNHFNFEVKYLNICLRDWENVYLDDNTNKVRGILFEDNSCDIWWLFACSNCICTFQ